MNRKQNLKGKTRIFHIVIPVELFEKIRELAAEGDRGVSDQCRKMFREWMERQ